MQNPVQAICEAQPCNCGAVLVVNGLAQQENTKNRTVLEMHSRKLVLEAWWIHGGEGLATGGGGNIEEIVGSSVL